MEEFSLVPVHGSMDIVDLTGMWTTATIRTMGTTDLCRTVGNRPSVIFTAMRDATDKAMWATPAMVRRENTMPVLQAGAMKVGVTKVGAVAEAS